MRLSTRFLGLIKIANGVQSSNRYPEEQAEEYFKNMMQTSLDDLRSKHMQSNTAGSDFIKQRRAVQRGEMTEEQYKAWASKENLYEKLRSPDSHNYYKQIEATENVINMGNQVPYVIGEIFNKQNEGTTHTGLFGRLGPNGQPTKWAGDGDTYRGNYTYKDARQAYAYLFYNGYVDSKGNWTNDGKKFVAEKGLSNRIDTNDTFDDLGNNISLDREVGDNYSHWRIPWGRDEYEYRNKLNDIYYNPKPQPNIPSQNNQQ
jgi:hypothetical protein